MGTNYQVALVIGGGAFGTSVANLISESLNKYIFLFAQMMFLKVLIQVRIQFTYQEKN